MNEVVHLETIYRGLILRFFAITKITWLSCLTGEFASYLLKTSKTKDISMKTIMIALMCLASTLAYSAEKKCVARATLYSVNYVQQVYQVALEDITVNAVNGNAEVPGVGGYVALGVNISLASGQTMTVIPMMTPGCVLVDINVFED